MHSMMDQLLKCVAILLSVYISYTSAELTEFLWSDHKVSGVYKNEDGSVGIKFVCKPGQLQIETLNNVTIVNFTSFHVVDKRMARSVHMLDGEYFQHKHSAHRHLDRSVGNTTKSFNDTLNDLLDMKEIRLLEEASHAIGEQGATGKNAPMMLPFHKFALRMTQLLDTVSPDANSNELSNQLHSSPWKKRGADCKKYRNNKDCKGLCGLRCWCWEWVCGDCCYHQACFDHDTCCERHGYFSAACIVNPNEISGGCDKRYHC